ncbi:hypothetical protein CD798_02000 [Bacillaceae bacterium SAOS 7]|nr:hypothetical protein CD798_02000 [Bacillaceae bacterium SAOS 7]
MSDLTRFMVVIGVLVVQHYLSRREQAYWGAVLPILYIAFLVYGKITNLFIGVSDKALLLIGVLGVVFLLGYWLSGREYVSKKRKREMEKIEVQNL